MTSIPPADSLLDDPLLRDAQTIEGFKVLDPAVLYAKVGQGGMGAVYRGRHCKLDLDVAVKCLKPSLAAESPEFVARFEREARLCASLAHQNVVRVMDVQQKAGLHYLVMEFVRGESVRERVQRKGPLPLPEALAILHGACAGLAEAHARGIVHRDIKPDNLLVSIEGRVKLADLGLAKAPAGSGHSLSIASAVMGTPQYMAPEQWETPDVGPAADVWALGATLYFVLTGEHGIEGASFAAMARSAQDRDFPALAAKCPQAPRAVLDLFARCVARQPQQRFASAKELLAALAPLVTVGEDALADAAAGSNQARLGVVTPPPRETLLRIRAVLETPTRPSGEPPRDTSEQNTVRSTNGPPTPPRRAVVQLRWPWLVGAPLLLLGAVAGALALDHGWGGDEAEWQATQRLAEARTLHGEAMQLLPQADGLDAAITKLERVLELVPAFAPAKAPLAMALDKRAERLTEADVDAAFVASARARELDSASEAIRTRHAALQNTLRARLTFGLEITSPAYDTVQNGPRLEVRGKVPAAGVARVTLVVARVGAPDSEVPSKIEVPVVAGEFATSVAAPDAGPVMLGIAAVDRHGVRGGALPVRVLVAGVAGALGKAPEPRAAVPQVLWNEAGLQMQPIPVRTFSMGSLELALGHEADEVRHRVTLTEPFWLAATEVTQQQWSRLMENAPWSETGEDREPGRGPATRVTWSQAVAFCDRLTERERAAGRLPDGYRYCLPTEAQWELAALGGGDPSFPHGRDEEPSAEVAVFGGTELLPQPVGNRPGNAFGLHDMAGNVDEWCADLATGERDVTTFTYSGDQQEPLSDIGTSRVLRGGNFRSPANDCRCAARTAAPPDTALVTIGFRPALAKRAE